VKSSASADAAARAGSWRMSAAGASECGPVRHDNQDAFGLVELRDTGLGLVLADGMGGHAGGGEAAEAATGAALVHLPEAATGAALVHLPEAGSGGLPGGPSASLAGGSDGEHGSLRQVVVAANLAVGEVRRRLGGSPGTTIEAAIMTAGRLRLAHVGDSRAYLLHDGVAQPLTFDHSVTAERVRAGTLTPEEARTDPRRNYVTRALLGDPVEADLSETELAAGDSVLLCSDGVWASLPDSRIGELLGQGTAAEAAQSLIRAALAAGSTDNVTAVVARIDREG